MVMEQWLQTARSRRAGQLCITPLSVTSQCIPPPVELQFKPRPPEPVEMLERVLTLPLTRAFPINDFLAKIELV
jgi:hypothetical protein